MRPRNGLRSVHDPITCDPKGDGWPCDPCKATIASWGQAACDKVDRLSAQGRLSDLVVKAPSAKTLTRIITRS